MKPSLCLLEELDGKPAMRCTHCGTVEHLQDTWPVPVAVLTAQSKRFLEAHRLCVLGLRQLYVRRKRVQAQIDKADWPVSRLYRRLKELEVVITRMKNKR